MNPLVCPKCQSEKIALLETYLTYREPIGFDEDGTLWFKSYAIVNWECDGDDATLCCNNCSYEWEVPQDVCYD